MLRKVGKMSFGTKEERELSKVARNNQINSEHLRGPKKIRFVELDSGKAAFIDKHHRVFFPEGFRPILGQEYRCYYVQTMTGIYVYKGERHRVCRVYLADKEDVTTDSYSSGSSYRDKKRNNDSPFAKLGALKLEEVYRVRAKSFKGEIKLTPVYKDSDPDFDDEFTMYFLNLSGRVCLEEGKTYRVKVESKRSTDRKNNRGALMVNVSVSIV